MWLTYFWGKNLKLLQPFFCRSQQLHKAIKCAYYLAAHWSSSQSLQNSGDLLSFFLKPYVHTQECGGPQPWRNLHNAPWELLKQPPSPTSLWRRWLMISHPLGQILSQCIFSASLKAFLGLPGSTSICGKLLGMLMYSLIKLSVSKQSNNTSSLYNPKLSYQKLE